MFDTILHSIELLMRVDTLLMMSLGLVLGIFIGALPGFTTTMAMAVLLPISFFLQPVVGIPFLIGVYKGGIFFQMFRILDRVSAASGGGRLPDWLATHPNPGDRIERLQKGIELTGQANLGTVVDRRPFLQQIDGIVYGPEPA